MSPKKFGDGAKPDDRFDLGDFDEPVGGDPKTPDSDDDDVGAMFDQAFGGESTAAKAEPPEPIAEPIPPRSSSEPVPTDGWFIGVNDEQSGPFTVAQIRDMWNAGEVGPDSLAWREGMGDWVALSTLRGLMALIAPEAAKPVVIATAPRPSVSAAPKATPVPTVRPSTGYSTARPSESGGWRPGASVALSSLVKDELSAIARPSIDIHAPATNMPGARETTLPPANPFTTSPATAYRAPSSNRGLFIGIGAVVGLLVLGLIGVVAWTATRPPQQVLVQAPTLPPVVVAPPPVQPAVTPSAAAPPPVDVPVAAAPKTTIEEPRRQGGGTRPSRAKSSSESSGGKDSAKGDDTSKATASAAPAPKRGAEKNDEFDSVFGGGSKPAAAADEKPKGAGFVPPPPGQGSVDVKDSLGKSDILEVALANKGALQTCITEQRKREPQTQSGTLVLKWTILTSGKVSTVNVVSEDLKNSYIAGCMSAQVKTWTFPRHLVQGEPTTFPFKF